MHACLARGMHGAWRGRWAFLLRQGAAHLGGVEGEVLHDVRHAALVLLLRHAAHAHLPAPSRLTLSAALASGAGNRALRWRLADAGRPWAQRRRIQSSHMRAQRTRSSAALRLVAGAVCGCRNVISSAR